MVRKAANPIPHVHQRKGEAWPREPRSGIMKNWTGWLTHREYDVIDMYVRLNIRNIYFFENPSRSAAGCESMFTDFLNSGIIRKDSTKTEFVITHHAMKLFRLTDQYLLDHEEAHEEDIAA